VAGQSAKFWLAVLTELRNRGVAENAELRMERDVLKRSVVLWVSEARQDRPRIDLYTGRVHREEFMARLFITGSTDGLGRSAAVALLDSGHQVVVHARNDERLSAVLDLVGESAISGSRGVGRWISWRKPPG
jgi:hypothetical protein